MYTKEVRYIKGFDNKDVFSQSNLSFWQNVNRN